MWILIRWLCQKPADLDLQGFLKLIYQIQQDKGLFTFTDAGWERSGSVVECLTPDRAQWLSGRVLDSRPSTVTQW